MEAPLRTSAATHVGRRPNNEDSYLVDPCLRLFAVADGMGGHAGGEVASAMTIGRLHDAIRQVGCRVGANTALTQAVAQSHEAVRHARHGALARMGSTLSAVLLEDGHATVAQVGDSRVYRLRDGTLERLTRDHNLAAELRSQGVKVAEDTDMAHILSRAIGTEHSEPDLSRVELRAGDLLLICSDGLYGSLDESEIVRVLSESPVELAANELVQLAFDAGASDNITAVVVRV